MRKGQTAMEYLMTYGWAILIVLIVGAIVILVVYPAISKPPPSKSGFGNIDIASPWDYNSAGQLRIQIVNKLGKEIAIREIHVNGVNMTDASPLPVTISMGEKSAPIVGTTGSLGSSGDSYKIDLAITYDVTNGLTGLTGIGTLVGTRS